MYQSKCSRELDHVLSKQELPLEWNIAEIMVLICVIKERSDGVMSKKTDPKLLYETLEHCSKDLVLYEQLLCGTVGDNQHFIPNDMKILIDPRQRVHVPNDVQM